MAQARHGMLAVTLLSTVGFDPAVKVAIWQVEGH